MACCRWSPRDVPVGGPHAGPSPPIRGADPRRQRLSDHNFPSACSNTSAGTAGGRGRGSRVLDVQALVGRNVRRPGRGPAGRGLRRSLPNPFLGSGGAWRAVRRRLSALLREDDRPSSIARLADRVLVPWARRAAPAFEVGDYVASTRPSSTPRTWSDVPSDSEPLLPNWRHLPVGYHGLSGSIVVGGPPWSGPTDRPSARFRRRRTGPPGQLDLELEMGFVARPGQRHGATLRSPPPPSTSSAWSWSTDWSARDIQRWEYQPLGPFWGSPSPPRSPHGW